MDRFIIVQSYYLFLCDTVEGQHSTAYKRLSKMLGYFKPGLGPSSMAQSAPTANDGAR